MTAADVAGRLAARPTGAGRWLARCPSHADRTPSLAIRAGDGGRVLLHCFAGCSFREITTALSARGIEVGQPLPPADRARLRAEQVARVGAERAERRRQRARIDALRDLDGRLPLLALAATADAPNGDMAAREYHTALDRRRDLEVA